VVELLEYNEAAENTEQLRRLLQLWDSRLPRKAQLGDVESWDAILMSRLTVLTIANEKDREIKRDRERARAILMSRLTVLTIVN
jgi:hypothetical protein